MIYHLDHNKKMPIFFFTDILSLKEKDEDLFIYQCMAFRLILYQWTKGTWVFLQLMSLICQQFLKLDFLINKFQVLLFFVHLPEV